MHIYYINPFHSVYGKQDLWQSVKTLMKSRIYKVVFPQGLHCLLRLKQSSGGRAGVNRTMRITIHFWHMTMA